MRRRGELFSARVAADVLHTSTIGEMLSVHVSWRPAPQVDSVRQCRAAGSEASEVKCQCQRPIDRKDIMTDRDMSGSHSKNTRKEKSSHADYTGSIVIEGRKFLAQRLDLGGDRGKFLSLSAKPAEEPRPGKSEAGVDRRRYPLLMEGIGRDGVPKKRPRRRAPQKISPC